MSETPEATGGNRHQGREVALQVLYAVDLAGHTSPRRRLDSPEDPDAEGGVDGGDEGAEGGPALATSVPTAEGSDRIFDRVAEHFVVPKGALDFARELVRGVVSRLPELDALVSLHARNWRVSRMAVVDRNVLRLGAHELRDTDTPVAVVIDEAVDLARRFGSDRSPSFVNGVLDAIAKEVRGA
ncbi:MAG: transcription antitermination factor NusB [Myxococcota bacterium]